MSEKVKEFNDYRAKMNNVILAQNNLTLKSKEVGLNTEQIYEVFAIANLVGGSIVVPHTRRAAEYWEELQKI